MLNDYPDVDSQDDGRPPEATPFATRTPDQVAAWAKKQKDEQTTGWYGQCQRFTRTAAGAQGNGDDAINAWEHARYRHTNGTPPRGSFVFWRGGSQGHGHAAVSAGDGDVYSTDLPVRDRVGRVKLTVIHERWHLKYLGWTEDVNGVHIQGLTPHSQWPQWWHVDPTKVTTGLNWYSSEMVKRGVRPPNFNVHIRDTVKVDGHEYAVTEAGNRYRMDYLTLGKYVGPSWYHTAASLEGYGRHWTVTQHRGPNFNIEVVAITHHKGVEYGITTASTRYRLDRLEKGRAPNPSVARQSEEDPSGETANNGSGRAHVVGDLRRVDAAPSRLGGLSVAEPAD